MAGSLLKETMGRVSSVLEGPRSKLVLAVTAGTASVLLASYVLKKVRLALKHREDGLKELKSPYIGVPVLGHAYKILGPNMSMRAVAELAMKHKPIVKLQFFDRVVMQTVDANTMQEVSERDDDFQKIKASKGPMYVLRTIAGDGLFTAGSEETNWKTAHRILTPVFALNALKDYVPVMAALCKKLLSRAEEVGQRDGAVDVPKLMTDLTFDTIGMCGLGVDFKALSSDQPPTFVKHMNEGLRLLMSKLFTMDWLWKLFRSKQQQRIEEGSNYMFTFVDHIIADRRSKQAAA
eukprot:GDKI01031771.1.p1 GENE.GDKI01031771.1~~GDKI01031771.1.p1  ORF type:complete len:292 (-),score=98.43 GDKI01031771.1:11-886(-)